MKSVVIARVVALALVGSGTLALAEEPRALVDDMWARYRKVQTEKEDSVILVITKPQADRFDVTTAKALAENRDRSVTRKRAIRRTRYAADRTDQVLVVFLEPADDRGTSYLVQRKPTEPQDSQWMFMPALKRVRQVVAEYKSSFVGTHLTYEDVRSLSGESTDRYEYAVEGEASCDDRVCLKVRVTPKPDTQSAYVSRRLWIDREWRFPVRTEFLDAAGAPIKVLYNTSVREVRPGVRRAELTEVRDLTLGEATLVLVTDRALDPTFSDETFSVNFLEHALDE